MRHNFAAWESLLRQTTFVPRARRSRRSALAEFFPQSQRLTGTILTTKHAPNSATFRATANLTDDPSLAAYVQVTGQ